MATKSDVIKKCEELIRSFNSVTHSIDTHVQDYLSGKSKFTENDKSFIQQVVYGWYRHKPALEGFINNFFADNAAKVARADKFLYIIFTYLAVYRLEDLGFPYFKQYTATQDPTKIFNLISYLFNTDNLWSILRAEWMKHYDLSFVEDELIAGIESFIPNCQGYLFELQEKAQGLAAAQAAKEQALKDGTAGLSEVEKRPTTIPISPKLTRPRPPRLPEPIEIAQNIIVNEVPANLNKLSLEKLEQQRLQRLDEIRQQTQAQYSDKHLFKLHPSGPTQLHNGRSLDDIRREVEEQQNAELKFNSSFVNEPPDFQSIPAKVRLNATAILREDSLYRKQQAKDVKLLKQYELELRDPSEFYSWQQQMKERDEKEKLELVTLRRQQAKLSSIDAREAMAKQREDNLMIGSLLREQGEEIKLQKELEQEITLLQNKEVVMEIMETREMKPREAKEKVLLEKQRRRKEIKEESEKAMEEKEKEDVLAEEIRADRIRQLKALNSVQREVVKVFDPTETAGTGVMVEMSYMEMKERLEMERRERKRMIENKHEEIVEEKEKKAEMLEKKSEGVMRARERRAEASREFKERERIKKEKEEIMRKEREMKSAIELNEELEKKRVVKRLEMEKLSAEAARVQRQQQYLGQAMGRVDEVRAEELMKGQEREIRIQQLKLKKENVMIEDIKRSELCNRLKSVNEEKRAKRNVIQASDMETLRERKRAVEKLKQEYQEKKEKVRAGHAQQERVGEVLREKNRYADRITREERERARERTERVGGTGGGAGGTGKRAHRATTS